MNLSYNKLIYNCVFISLMGKMKSDPKFSVKHVSSLRLLLSFRIFWGVQFHSLGCFQLGN